MNFYSFHIGDYLSATRHLSWVEDAAFRRLLDVYYTNEKPLPSDLRAIYRLVIASTDEQREAVETILNEFFEATPEGWVNHRADAEIEVMREKQQKQRDKANKRWHCQDKERGNAPAMPRHSESDAEASKSDADAMPPIPIPIPIPREVPNGTSLAAKRRTRIPAEFTPNDNGQRLALERGIDAHSELQRFHDYHSAKGTVMADWQAAWRTWVGNARPQKPVYRNGGLSDAGVQTAQNAQLAKSMLFQGA